jgi:hypothetical protein
MMVMMMAVGVSGVINNCFLGGGDTVNGFSVCALESFVLRSDKGAVIVGGSFLSSEYFLCHLFTPVHDFLHGFPCGHWGSANQGARAKSNSGRRVYTLKARCWRRRRRRRRSDVFFAERT